ncbi:MAG: SurA N-terminal domain-containing protein [Thermodesulfobacteriota bacterium]
MTKRIRSLFLLLALFILAPGASAAAGPDGQMVDRVVAVVNNDVITLREVEIEGKPLFQQIVRRAAGNDVNTALAQARKDVLASLIDKLLVEQRAAELGLTVEDGEIDDTLQRMAAGNGMTLAALEERIAREGMSLAVYRQQVRWQILQSRLITHEIRAKVVVPDEKARAYYQTAYEKDAIKEGYHLLQFGILIGEGESPAAAERKAGALRQRILAGESFADLAAQFSELPSAKANGDVGYFLEEEMSPEMREAIVSLKPGELTGILALDDKSYQFFKLLSVRKGDVIEQAPYEAVKDEIVRDLYDEELKKQYDRWVTDLRGQAYIREFL